MSTIREQLSDMRLSVQPAPIFRAPDRLGQVQEHVGRALRLSCLFESTLDSDERSLLRGAVRAELGAAKCGLEEAEALLGKR